MHTKLGIVKQRVKYAAGVKNRKILGLYGGSRQDDVFLDASAAVFPGLTRAADQSGP